MECYSNILLRNGYGKLYIFADRIEWISYTCGKFVILNSSIIASYIDADGNRSYLINKVSGVFEEIIVFCPVSWPVENGGTQGSYTSRIIN